MIGGEAVVRSLVASGVDVVFANPGTSEMHFVASLDAVPEMHGVLALFEGAATGAADGYARMRDTPAAALLHLGPGLGNGLANLHNARRAHSPVVVIVGDHATYHKQYDAPLEVRHRHGGEERLDVDPADHASGGCRRRRGCRSCCCMRPARAGDDPDPPGGRLMVRRRLGRRTGGAGRPRSGAGVGPRGGCRRAPLRR